MIDITLNGKQWLGRVELKRLKVFSRFQMIRMTKYQNCPLTKTARKTKPMK